VGVKFELRQAIDRLLNETARIVAAPVGIFALFDKNREIVEFLSCGVDPGHEAEVATKLPSSGILELVPESGAAVRISHLGSHPAFRGFPLGHPQVKSLVAASLTLPGDVTGVLYFGNDATAGGFDEDDERTVSTVAELVELGIENFQNSLTIKTRESWVGMCAETTRRLLDTVDRGAALHSLVHRIREVTNADTAVLARVDRRERPDGLLPEAVAGVGQPPASIEVVRPSLVAHVIDAKAPVLTTDSRSDPRFNPAAGWSRHGTEVGPTMYLPLVAHAETLGVLMLSWPRASDEPTNLMSDPTLHQALSDQAALVLHQLGLHEERERRERWLEASLWMTRLLLEDVDRDEALTLVVRELRKVSGADSVTLLVLDPQNPDDSVTLAVEGLDLERTQGMRVSRRGLMKKVIETGKPVVSDNLPGEPNFDPVPEWKDALSTVGFGMLVPLLASGEVEGVLCLGWVRGTPQERQARDEQAMVKSFASQAALALQHLQSQEARARMRVLEDRDRIASDLHDVVIQRLFAVEMGLHTAAGLSTAPQVKSRIDRAIDELDDLIREVRSTIFQLHHEEREEGSIRTQLLYEIDSARAILGFTPRLVVRGPVDRGVPPELRGELIPAVRDALNHVATHASPTSVEVTVRLTEDELALAVSDDGTKRQTSEAVSCLADLRTRAEHLGGTLEVSEESGGNQMTWRVPLTA
jgi:signal transduction histidine kinase